MRTKRSVTHGKATERADVVAKVSMARLADFLMTDEQPDQDLLPIRDPNRFARTPRMQPHLPYRVRLPLYASEAREALCHSLESVLCHGFGCLHTRATLTGVTLRWPVPKSEEKPAGLPGAELP